MPAVEVSDTLKRIEGDRVVDTVPRDGVVAVQTPQAFRAGALRAARTSPAATRPTTPASWRRTAARVVVVAGDPRNLKVTTLADLAVVQALLEDAAP